LLRIQCDGRSQWRRVILLQKAVFLASRGLSGPRLGRQAWTARITWIASRSHETLARLGGALRLSRQAAPAGRMPGR
jgi:hypothetical protein